MALLPQRRCLEEDDILNFNFSPSITLRCKGSGVTIPFVFPYATYDVTYPADVPVSNTTMTITPTVLSPADCTRGDCSIQATTSAATTHPR